MIDTGSLIWLHAVQGVDPMTMPEFTEWEVDPRPLAKTLIEKESE